MSCSLPRTFDVLTFFFSFFLCSLLAFRCNWKKIPRLVGAELKVA